MQLVFLVIQIILAVAIIGTVLLQKNGVDGLGSLGGGSGMSGGNIISGRASANFLTRATTVLMMCFMANSLILGNLSARSHKEKSVVEKIHHHNSDHNHHKNHKIIEEKKIAPQAPVSE